MAVIERMSRKCCPAFDGLLLSLRIANRHRNKIVFSIFTLAPFNSDPTRLRDQTETLQEIFLSSPTVKQTIERLF